MQSALKSRVVQSNRFAGSAEMALSRVAANALLALPLPFPRQHIEAFDEG